MRQPRFSKSDARMVLLYMTTLASCFNKSPVKEPLLSETTY